MGNSAYEHMLAYLYERLPMFSRIGKAALKPDLTNTLKLCEALGNPHLKIKSVHVAGTNGKGSVSHALAAILQDAGYSVGLYTSPHLIDFRERIKIGGVPVSKEWVVAFVEENREHIEAISPSFFEITVAMAFKYFAEQHIDIAIIETGLGGRLDSTNVITPLLSVITNISYDHKDLLGQSLAEIANEKAGIIKHGVPVVIGEQAPETERVFFEHSVHKQSVLHYAQSLWGMVRVKQTGSYDHYKAINNAQREMTDLVTDLQGNYQQHNLKTVLTAVELLSHQGFNVNIAGAIKALAHVKKSTGLRGRWDQLQQSPAIYCDVAHNQAGLAEVLAQFQQVPGTRKHIILGFVKDKEVAEALTLFPKDATYYFTNAQIDRALPADTLKTMANETGLSGDDYKSVTEALNAAKARMAPDDATLITGSFFIVGEALSMFPAVAAHAPEV
jgi:dihydrofolate synthase / folylpolyglutamate synthase